MSTNIVLPHGIYSVNPAEDDPLDTHGTRLAVVARRLRLAASHAAAEEVVP